MNLDFTVIRDGQVVELSAEVTCWEEEDVNAAGADIGKVTLADGQPWNGELTAEECDALEMRALEKWVPGEDADW